MQPPQHQKPDSTVDTTHEESSSILFETATGDEDPEVRAEALSALESAAQVIPRDQAISVARRATKDPDPSVRLSAIRLLGRLLSLAGT